MIVSLSGCSPGKDATAQALEISDGRTVTGYTSVDGQRRLTIWACD